MIDMSQQAVPSASEAIEQAREVWLRGYRDATAAGREVPVVEVPRSLGDVARTSVEATQSLTRAGNRRSYVITVDLAALERQRQARLANEAAAQEAKGQRPSRRQRKAARGGRSRRG